MQEDSSFLKRLRAGNSEKIGGSGNPYRIRVQSASILKVGYISTFIILLKVNLKFSAKWHINKKKLISV